MLPPGLSIVRIYSVAALQLQLGLPMLAEQVTRAPHVKVKAGF